MAQERTQPQLEEELRASQSQIAPHDERLEREHLATCGKAYGSNPDNAEVDDEPENWRFTWIRNFLAEVAQGTPEVTIEARGRDWPEERARLLEAAVNQIWAESRSERFIQSTAIDFGFRSARAACGLEMVGGRLMPVARQLAFDECLSDATVTNRDRARWWTYRVSRDIEDVIAEAEQQPELGWNLDALHELRNTLTNDPKSRAKTGAPVERRELVYWPMWWPGDESADPEDGFNGTIHYAIDPRITQATKLRSSAPIRAAEPYFGHHTGPIAFSAGFKIGELAIELAPLVASAPQGAALNDVARAVYDAVIEYKRNGACSNETVAALVRAARNGDLITTPAGLDVRSMIGEIESGGLTQQHLVAFQQLFESMQRATGIHSRLGDVDSDATATAIQQAQVGYASTMGLYIWGYLSFLRQISEKWAYWTDLSPDVEREVEVPPELQQQLVAAGRLAPGSGPIVRVQGGGGNPRAHRNLGLAINVFSLRAKNELTMAQDIAVAQADDQFIASLGINALAYDIDGHQRAVARSRGAKWMERRWDSNMLRMLALAQLGAGGQEAPQPQPTARPMQQITFGAGASRPQPQGASLGQPRSAPQRGGGARGASGRPSSAAGRKPAGAVR